MTTDAVVIFFFIHMITMTWLKTASAPIMQYVYYSTGVLDSSNALDLLTFIGVPVQM